MHGAGELSADRQSEADALLRWARQLSVDLHERLEDAVDINWPDADAGVGHTQIHHLPGDCAHHFDAAAGGSEFDGVGDQIEEDLLEPLGISCDANLIFRSRHGQRESLCLCLKRAKSLDFCQYGVHRDRGELQGPSAFESGDGKHVVYQT